jgi:nitrite reductase/ring-hydroxylating ferredoxin subunit
MTRVHPDAPNFVRAARVADVKAAGCRTAQVAGHTLLLVARGEGIFAVDNRCPHMGFPLHRGSVHDGILTCHWHHARFDLASGGTFDPWADDVRAFPVEIRDGDVWVDVAAHTDARVHHRRRLMEGLERDIPLVLGKSVIALLDSGEDPAGPFRLGLDFGAKYRQEGWGPGLTIHTCMMNLLPHLDAADRPRAAYHGLAAVARDCAGMAPRFRLQPLPTRSADLSTLKDWFRRFVEVRDAEGAERCLVSAIRAGADHRYMADMLFAAATDHRYIQIGHVADFTNKALEALDHAGWEYAESVLAGLASGYAGADRMEESNAWRHPIDLVMILARAFEELPAALAEGRNRRGAWLGRDGLVPILVGEDPQAIADALLEALREGAGVEEVAGTVAYAAALRVARFHTSNEFGDWDTALHTFTFANAIHQGLRRSPSPELLRGVFDAAIGVYLDRFLNVPAARLPEPGGTTSPADVLHELPEVMDRQQQVNEAGEAVACYFHGGGRPEPMLALLGKLLLREDRDFHTIQMVEAAFRQYGLLGGGAAGAHVLIAAARYLAAHAPTVRAQGQTYQIAHRLHRGEDLFAET